MRLILATAALLASCSFASADCRAVATGENGAKVYQCDAPAAPVAPVRCWHLNGALLCTGELKDGKPSNCDWKSGKYVCW